MGIASDGKQGMGTESELASVFASASDLTSLIRFTPSTLDSFRSTFHPDLSAARVQATIYDRMMQEGRFTPTRPEWVVGSEDVLAVGYVVLADIIALRIRPDRTHVCPFVAVSLAVRG